MSDNAIELSHIGKTYVEKEKTTRALDDFSIEVPRGQFVTLMGSSGCGKSTITKIAAGIEAQSEGVLRIDGEEIAPGRMPIAVKRRIGYVFQWHNLAQWRTVEGNLYFPLEMLGEKKDASWKKRADRYLEMVGLAKYRSVYPSELSGGMKQRVGIARALMAEPDILVFDQPFGALDAMTRATLSNAVSDLVRGGRKTMLMVTSDLDEAIHYSDAIYVMQGPPGRIYERVDTGVTQQTRKRSDFASMDTTLATKLRLTRAIYGIDAGNEVREGS